MSETEEGKGPVAPFLVVGVGASAGGLDALGELVRGLVLDGMAMVVIQHLSPVHESSLTEILARESTCQVVTAADGQVVEANHIYVIPPNADLAIMQGVLHLITPAGARVPRLPIDFFFRSLALDQGPSAVGVVLSGTGSDGTFGLKALKAAGGITYAQVPASARYGGMPRSALASGYADFSLVPAEIGRELVRLAQQVPGKGPSSDAPPAARALLDRLFLLIRSEFGTDLSQYKLPTVERRIERRMTMHKLARLDDYVALVGGSIDELRALYADMLITVTSFFRDGEPFEALKAKVLPGLLDKKAGSTFRVWVPACATGEEPYSLAMTLLELAEEKQLDLRFQIFGTDIDEDAIQLARRGVYPPNIALDVSPERLSRFFLPKGADFQVTRRVRDLVVFSRQDVLKDAPFSRMDLVSCRNLLIYLQPEAQRKVLQTLNYALCPSGALMLGTSETIGNLPSLFSLIDRKNKIYVKKYPASAADLELAPPPSTVGAGASTPRSSGRPVVSLQALVDRRVLEQYGPAGVVVNAHLEILQFRGQTAPYLAPTPGAASLNLLRVVRPELHMELQRVTQEALASQTPVRADVSFTRSGEATRIRLEVIPIQEPESGASCLLVMFQPLSSRDGDGAAAVAAALASPADAPLGIRIQELERELVLTKEYLQATIDEKEIANEELKSANEELQSANEELQSTNEELETSKEEMQSTNEELTTVNDELQTRMNELGEINDDLHNLLTHVDHPLVLVGMDLRIRRFTREAEKLFNLVPEDLGRTVQLLDKFCATGIQARVAGVIQSLAIHEEELTCEGRRYRLRIAPYRTLDDAIRGAIVSLVDVEQGSRKGVGDGAAG